MYPTLRASDANGAQIQPGKQGGLGLNQLMATLTSRDWRSGKASQETMERNSRPLSEQIGGQLNPTWCEWLMGFPEGWTDLEHSETQ